MKVRQRSGATCRREATEDPEIDHGLDAMSAPELRAAIRVVLDPLDDGVKASVMDALLARGVTAKSGWKPARPSPRIVEEAKSFSDAARQIGHPLGLRWNTQQSALTTEMCRPDDDTDRDAPHHRVLSSDGSRDTKARTDANSYLHDASCGALPSSILIVGGCAAS